MRSIRTIFSEEESRDVGAEASQGNLSFMLKKNATLATWCVASAVRKAFNEAGFTIQKVPGFGHKSEMTVGRFEPKFKHRRSTAFLSTANEPQTAIVIGAGLAGSAVACELASRGVKVQVIDAGPVGASGASALRWGVVHAQPPETIISCSG